MPGKSLTKFCEIVKADPELKITDAVFYEDAPKFKAHNFNEEVN